MTVPFRIFLDGRELLGWTSARLSRKKADLTGEFNCDVFFKYVPQKPVMVEALRGRNVTVYVGGHLAFFGALDRRNGQGKTGKSGTSQVTSDIGPDQYRVSFSARGQTKYLVDSSQQHQTGTMLRPKTREVAEALLKPFNIELDWQSGDFKLDKVRFRDGILIVDELRRLGNENGLYMYETRDGKLRVTEQPVETGEDLILGRNILSFSADQTEEHERSDILVRGQRTELKVWGKDAVQQVEKLIKNNNVTSKIPYIIQHFGDATPEALDRRAKFESDIRTAQSLRVNVEVFHVQSQSGDPWDIGMMHYVEVPPEGVFDELECVELEYTVDADKTLQTRLTLAPPPSKGDGKNGLKSALGSESSKGRQRRTQLGVNDQDVWKSSEIETITTREFPDPGYFSDLKGTTTPPLTIPPTQ